MASKNEVLLRFQQDLQELNGCFEGELTTIEATRLQRFRALDASCALVDTADQKTAEALAERKSDRERATAAREQSVAVAVQKRRTALEASQRTWRRAEEQAERARDGARLAEGRKHEDRTAEVDAILPMYEQAAPREAENERHELALTRIEEDFANACDRARADSQAANESALADELRATELANDAEQQALAAADAECEWAVEHVRAQLSDALSRLAATRDLEAEFQRQLRDTRGRWAAAKEALRARFKADYAAAS